MSSVSCATRNIQNPPSCESTYTVANAIQTFSNCAEMPEIHCKASSTKSVEAHTAKTAQQIKVIATDLDGTFLNAHHNVSEKNAAAFRAAKDSGCIVLAATGRSRQSALEGIGEDRLKEMNYLNLSPGVFMNGMVVYGKNGELLYEHAMDEKQLKDLVEFMENEGLLRNFLVYEGPHIWCQELNEHTEIPNSVYGEVVPEEIEGHLSKAKCNKAVVCVPDDQIMNIRNKLVEKFDDVFDFFYSLPMFLEIVPKGANKMTGITYLLKDLGVKPHEVMAIGDSENDCDLLRGIGFPVAVGNACDKSKT